MSKTSFDIAIVVPGLRFDGDTIKTKGLGGSETAAYYMAKELASIGNRVVMFTETDRQSISDNVVYMPLSQWQGYCANVPHDITIVQRHPEYFGQPTNSKLNILWCHDLAAKRSESKFKTSLWNIDRVFTVSKWHTKQMQTVYGMGEFDELFYSSRNGIDIDLINEVRSAAPERDMNRYVYGSRPERGLDVMLNIFPRILQQNPNAYLCVPTYDIGIPQLQQMYDQMYAQAKQAFGDHFQPLGSLSKVELYKLYTTSAAYLYPTPGAMDKVFKEVSCISAMEAMACGLPVITSDVGALPETVNGKAGYLIKGDSTSEEYAMVFTGRVADAARNFSAMSAAGIEHAQGLSWRDVAKDWVVQFESMIRANNADPVRRTIDFWRNSDIMAIQHEKASLPAHLHVAHDLADNYNFIWSGFKEHYEKVNSSFHPQSVEASKGQFRYKLLEQWYVDKVTNDPSIKTVLDYACHDGGYTTNLALMAPQVNILGVDFNQLAIDHANKLAEQKDAANVNYKEISQVTLKENFFDMLTMQEVLEHVTDPWDLVDSQEKFVRDDGYVYITVPFGPWEYDSYGVFRAHIWHFDRHDLYEMFADKAELHVGAAPMDKCIELPSSRGWWIVTYKKNGKPCRKIDMERKLWLQRPRQTVSLCVMAGKGSGNQSRWMLESTKHIVDEIVVADTGMGDTDRAIFEEFGAVIVPSVDPKVYGFETPRNHALEKCTMDWVLWLDTDERLIDPINIHKYLRQNIFRGYGIRQHHFAVDTTFPPDMPVRMFRNTANKAGKKMKFIGMIHEHPETDLNEGPGFVVVLADTNIAHTGYLSESIRRARFYRNLPMLERDSQRYPERLLQKHFVMRDSIQLAMYMLQMTSGRVTPEIVKLCEDTIMLFNKHFLGNNTLGGIDSLQWYSTALEILGRGIWCTFTAQVSSSAFEAPVPQQRKFENLEAYTRHINALLDVYKDQYNCEYQ